MVWISGFDHTPWALQPFREHNAHGDRQFLLPCLNRSRYGTLNFGGPRVSQMRGDG